MLDVARNYGPEVSLSWAKSKAMSSSTCHKICIDLADLVDDTCRLVRRRIIKVL